MHESDLFIYLNSNILHCKSCNEELQKSNMEKHVKDNHMNES